MIYRQLFDRMAPGKTVAAGVIGTGDFSTAIMAQSALMPRLDVSVAADLDVARAERAYLQAGFGRAALRSRFEWPSGGRSPGAQRLAI